MQQNNSFVVATAFKNHFAACNSGHLALDYVNPKLTFNVGDLSQFIPSDELQNQWGLVPGHSLEITMESPIKFKASLISSDMESNDRFALKTQLEVMLENLVNPDQSEKAIIQAIWEMLVDMGFDEEVSRLATIESENNLERAIELAIPISSKIRAENLLAQHAQQNNLDLGLRKYFEARLENLTSFCLLCDNVIENQNPGKSCVCSRALCEWQFKQIGLVPTTTLNIPRLVQGLPPAHEIVSLAAGDYHSVACFQNGKVFSWGKGTACQLGNGCLRSSAVAVEVDSLQGFVKVAAGRNFTVALTADGRLFVWGCGSAELGLGCEKQTIAPKPTQIHVYNEGGDVVYFDDISVANRMSFAVTSRNELYSWGEQEEHCWNIPTPVCGLAVKSVTAHHETPVCVDLKGRIRIWSSFHHTFVPTIIEHKLPYVPQAKVFTRAMVFQHRLFASAEGSESVFEYSLKKDNGGWTLVHKCEHFGVQKFTAGTTFAVMAQNGVVRVAGTGSEVMCSDEEVTYDNGFEVPQIRRGQHLAAGPHHVICVAMSDRIVYGPNPEDEARNVFVYQWGRDHSTEAAVECKADVQKQQELKWARLADQARAASDGRIPYYNKPGYEPLPEEQVQQKSPDQYYDLECNGNEQAWKEFFLLKPDGKHDYDASDLQDWKDQLIRNNVKYNNNNPEDELREVALDDEKKDREVALDILEKCYEVRDQLNIQLQTDQSQLVIDLNHPALLVGKICDENSSFKDVNIDVNAKDNNGNTALILAMKSNDYDLFSRLVDVGLDLDAMNNEFEFPLDIAVSCGTSYSKSFVVLLVEKGATKFSPLNHDQILTVVAAAAEYFPKLATRLDALKAK